ncbi:hypothetical protein RHGRI_034876 [Rhododendron griersonianum]|uniref:Uncharacterized protein n=1 Tax=Rhododendron griersonianum TaxID=479676 RepID=A0AAV6I384_9ERIC|nr:hypothetical protein RHGRI_034876 [Rhododendron griersonianum]
MGVASKTGEWAFKAFTAGLGVATIYLAATFSVNVYRGLSWHNAQSVINPNPLCLSVCVCVCLSLSLIYAWFCLSIGCTLADRAKIVKNWSTSRSLTSVNVVFGYREVMVHWYIRRSGLFSSRKELVEVARMPH